VNKTAWQRDKTQINVVLLSWPSAASRSRNVAREFVVTPIPTSIKIPTSRNY